jgi:hypothetical protein
MGLIDRRVFRWIAWRSNGDLYTDASIFVRSTVPHTVPHTAHASDVHRSAQHLAHVL